MSARLAEKWKLMKAVLCNPSNGLSDADKAVLSQMLDRYNAEIGAACLSINTLARDTGRDKRTVMRSLKRLQESGFVLVVERGDRRGRSNKYKPVFISPATDAVKEAKQ